MAGATRASSTEEPPVNQRPYRLGLALLCTGALLNWLGLAQAYVEPMRYVGVACVLAGALLICAAVCRWLGRAAPLPAPSSVMVVSVNVADCKPPDYESLSIGEPPSYEDAVKLRPPCDFVPPAACPDSQQQQLVCKPPAEAVVPS